MGEARTLLIPAIDGVAYGLLLSMLAAGLSIAWGTGRILNLSHGTVYLIGAYTTAALSHGTISSYLAALATATAAGAAAGVGLAAATRPVARRGPLPQALLTFGLALIGGDLLTDVFGTNPLPVTVPTTINGTVSVAGQIYPTYRLLLIAATTLLIGTGVAVLHHTRIGLIARAAADNPTMLATHATNPTTVHIAVLTVAGAVAGLTGALGAPLIGPGPGAGDTVLLLCLVVVVLGGPGRIGAVIGAGITVGEVQSLGVVIAPQVAPYLLFAALLTVLTVRRDGLPGAGR